MIVPVLGGPWRHAEGNRGRRLLLVLYGLCQILSRLGVIGLEPHCLLKTSRGGGELSLQGANQAEVVMGLCKSRPKAQRMLQLDGSLVESAQGLAGGAEKVVDG